MQAPNTRIADRLFFFIAVFGACFALFIHYGIRKTKLSTQDFEKPAKYIHQHFQKGDKVWILPSWLLEAGMALEKEHRKTPDGKKNAFPLLLSESVKGLDLSEVSRLWVVHAPFVGKWWFRRSFQKNIQRLKKHAWRKKYKIFGHLEVSLFHFAPQKGWKYRFLDSEKLMNAEVGLETPSRDFAGAKCSKEMLNQTQWLKKKNLSKDWFEGTKGYFFGKIVQEIGDTPRDCLWAMPLSCKVLKVRYRNVPFSSPLFLEHGIGTSTPGGLAGSIKQREDFVQLEIWVDGAKHKEFEINRLQGWKQHWVRFTKKQSQRKTGSIEFRIQTPQLQKNFAGYCFRARL